MVLITNNFYKRKLMKTSIWKKTVNIMNLQNKLHIELYATEHNIKDPIAIIGTVYNWFFAYKYRENDVSTKPKAQ